MSLDLVFNELSMLPMAPDQERARQRAHTFVQTVRYARQKGMGELRTQEAFRDSMLAAGYSWWRWTQDPEVPREARLYLKSLAVRAPYLDGLEALQDQAARSDFLFAGRKAEGLGVAFMNKGLAVSLFFDGMWDKPSLDLTIQELQEDGQILEYKDSVYHASRPDHVDRHEAWIQEFLEASVVDGAALWAQRGTCFPSLVFCEAVQEQMRKLPREKVPSFFRGLRCLEKYCQEWQSGGFNQSALGCQSSPEGQTALDQYAQERTFTLPNGERKIFNYHVKLGNPWRILYDPDFGPGKICVGFVGFHLRTRHDH